MQRNNKHFFMRRMLAFLWSGFMITAAQAGVPLWTFEPLTATTIAVPPGVTDTVQYRVTNQSSRAKNLVIQPTSGMTQSSTCNLVPKGRSGSSCTLTLTINGSNLPEGGIQNGPILCQANQDGSANVNQCYQPSRANVLHVIRLPNLTIGQSFQGGVVACLNGGLTNLIAATADNSTIIQWGGFGVAIGAGAQSNTDGASNTAAIVVALGNNGGTPYAAQLCNDFEVDSQGNTPCQAGNTCYNDWFLPAGNNLTASGQLNCLFTNRATIGGFASDLYWSSTEDSVFLPTTAAWFQNFGDGLQGLNGKNDDRPVRCVRAFTP